MDAATLHHAGIVRRIAIVDDESADAIARVLDNTGERIALRTAADAIQAVESTRFTLLIIDYILSGREHAGEGRVRSPHGVDVLAAARATTLNADSPAILLSGEHDTTSINAAVDLHARILAKPFHANQLFQLIFELLTLNVEERTAEWSATFHFTPREAQLFALKVRAVSDDECAAVMNIKRSMVDEHRKHILRKVNGARRSTKNIEFYHFPDLLNAFYRDALGILSSQGA